jgi:nucleoside-diphosphate-sugar epimerase
MEVSLRFDKVLVTGAAGLLGRAVVGELQGRCTVTGLDLRAGEAPIAWHAGDVTDPEVVRRAVTGCDAVLHIAAIPNIWSGTGERIMRVNVIGTWQVLQAAEAAGVRRVVLCSSDSVVGFTVREGRMLPPDYLPIDAHHPLRPTEPYGLGKLLGEEAGRSFAHRGLEVVVLRPVFVAYPEMQGEIRARARDPEGYRGPAVGGPSAAGGGPCWHHVDPRDAARAFRLALELPQAPFQAFFVSAAVTLAPEPTLERLARVLGRLPEVRRPGIWQDNPFAPLYDLGPTRDVLGLVPEHDARHLLEG